ncbi:MULTISPECIES: hypothetical protein [unclassified Rickettsia]|nr:hypothetical protein [Rickettsia endosymbiont of Ceutorhynchus assimilis]
MTKKNLDSRLRGNDIKDSKNNIKNMSHATRPLCNNVLKNLT